MSLYNNSTSTVIQRRVFHRYQFYKRGLTSLLVLIAEHNQGLPFEFNANFPESIFLKDAAVNLDQITSSARSLYNLRILVVDDNADDRDLLALLFEQEGAEVILAASANEAFNWCQRIKIDVLVSDICMPEEDGYTLIQRVRLLPQSQGQIPAIALSSSLSETYREQAFRAGFQRYLFKPIDVEELIATITQLLN
ncbi:response regulator [Gloeocapsa sp. PCC 7428]|uniref:response regulator n=1 Tax=Gloeocapsa sp. PCC 7428 TaxID=1173026 RepID=UPI0018C8CDA8|nr:response regulator [Gloeocapsa sp. PCC 7428]